jgi:hypothetical protein
MIIVSQLIEELDSLGIIVLHDKPSKYVDGSVEVVHYLVLKHMDMPCILSSIRVVQLLI